MRKVIVIFSILLSFKSYALGGYDTLTDNQKKALKDLVEQLGIKDESNKLKYKIFGSDSYAFEGDWGSRWYGLNELEASKINSGKEKGFIEFVVNNSQQGVISLAYVYKPEVQQIVVIRKQIRPVDKKLLLEEFEKRKSDTNKYALVHEGKNYALLQEKGKINFEYYNVGDTSSVLVYQSQTIIGVE